MNVEVIRTSFEPGAVPVGPNEYDQLKGQFLASLNHELRTPLNGVLGMSELLLETGLDEEQREYVQILRECSTQLMETLNSVLDYTAISAGDFRLEESEFHLRSLLEAVINEVRPRAESKGLLLRADMDRALPETIIGDERYIRQLLLHLLRNAVKFTTRGHVDLSVEVEPASSSRVNLRIVVRDTGIGIAPEKLKVIFESFRQLDGGLTRSYSGLGLGLALVEKVTQLMDGTIEVSSEPGVGSVFTIDVPCRIPVGPTGPQLVHSATPTRAAEPGLRRVLIADDNKIAQQVVGQMLQRAHYDVICADDGQHALRLAAEQHFDIILMDLEMPGLDGFAATRRLREMPDYEAVPIFALTATCSEEDRTLSQQLRMQGLLVKPIQKEELLNSLRRFLP